MYLLLPELGCTVARISIKILNHCCECCSKQYIKTLHVYFPFQDLNDLLGNLSQDVIKKWSAFFNKPSCRHHSHDLHGQARLCWKLSSKITASFHLISCYFLCQWHCLALSVLPGAQLLVTSLPNTYMQNWQEKKALSCRLGDGCVNDLYVFHLWSKGGPVPGAFNWRLLGLASVSCSVQLLITLLKVFKVFLCFVFFPPCGSRN